MRCTGRNRSWSMGEHPIHEHPQASYALHRRGSLVGPLENTIHEHPRAPCALQQIGNAHGPMGEYPVNEHTRASRELHRQGLRMGSWENTPSTSINEHPVRCNKHGSLMGPWESTPYTSIHEHPVHCTGMDRPWVHGRAPHPRASTSTLCAAHVGIAHGPMGEYPIHEHPRASCALHR